MQPITNSRVKEEIRQKNERQARELEHQMTMKLRDNLKEKQGDDEKAVLSRCIAAAIIIAVINFLFGGSFGTLIGLEILTGIPICLVITGLSGAASKIKNTEAKMQQQMQDEIAQMYRDSEEKTRREIKEYDETVAQYAKKILMSASKISAMTDHAVEMFQRMISHADDGAYNSFIEVDFIYEVLRSEIKYYYESQYANPRDSYSFKKGMFRDLETAAECEGLAQALAKIIIVKMKELYQTANIKVSHEDAKVTLHFRCANPKARIFRDII